MKEQLEHIKKFALQDNSALTVMQLGEAIARMCDDAIREAVEHSVHPTLLQACVCGETKLTALGLCASCGRERG